MLTYIQCSYSNHIHFIMSDVSLRVYFMSLGRRTRFHVPSQRSVLFSKLSNRLNKE
jgi:hypothetical protein